MERKLTPEMMEQYCRWLREKEASRRTIERYQYSLRNFSNYIEGKQISKLEVLRWKEHLKKKFAPVTVNAALVAVNGMFRYFGWTDLIVRYVKIKKKIFCPEEKELSREEYERLVRTAMEQHNHRLALIIQTICSTGMRVSELRCVTVEAVERKYAVVENKGGIRTVFIPSDLCRQLKIYAEVKQIASGVIFVTRSGKPIDRASIWRQMKRLAAIAGVEEEKIYPHNLRHLFARVYYDQEKDLSRLADILGHCDINTTKIYTVESGENHARQMEEMGLIVFDSNELSAL